MAVELVALEAASAVPLMRRRVSRDLSSLVEDWRKLEDRLNSEGRAGVTRNAEIYLIYLGPPFENYDHQWIESLTSVAKKLAPDGRTSAVLDVHTADQVDPTLELDALECWSETAQHAGLDDVLELPLDLEFDADLFRLLRVSCDRSKARHKVLVLSRGADPWSAVFAERSPKGVLVSLEGILDPYVRYGLATGRSPVVVVVRSPVGPAQRRLVERVLAEHRPGQAVIANLSGTCSRGLKELCSQTQLELLHFSGLLELRYFLLQINVISWSLRQKRTGLGIQDSPSLFEKYEAACEQLNLRLRGQLGIQDPRYKDDFLGQEHRLRAAIQNIRTDGPTNTEWAEINRAVRFLNKLATETLGLTFNSLIWPGSASANR